MTAGLTTANNERMAALDLLRLVSALVVVFFHFGFRGAAGADPFMQTAYPEAAPYAIYGYLGLNLFFMISGFVIAWSAAGRSCSSFAIARFARIYPGFIACMSLSFLIQGPWGGARFTVTPGQYLANLGIVAPAFGRSFVDGVYWTIVLEIIFYGWVALALASGLSARWKLPALGLWLAVSQLNEHVIHNTAIHYVLITEYAPFFAIGVLAHHATQSRPDAETMLLVFAAFMAALASLGIERERLIADYGVAPSAAALAIAGAAIILLFHTTVAIRRVIPGNELTLMLGGLTYPLYMLHQHAGYIAIDALASTLGRWIAALLVVAAALVLSWAVWRFVERPGQRMIRTRLQAVLAIHSLEDRPKAPAQQ